MQVARPLEGRGPLLICVSSGSEVVQEALTCAMTSGTAQPGVEVPAEVVATNCCWLPGAAAEWSAVPEVGPTESTVWVTQL